MLLLQVLERLGAAQLFRFPSPPTAAALGTLRAETPSHCRLNAETASRAVGGSGTQASPRSSGEHQGGGARGVREVRDGCVPEGAAGAAARAEGVGALAVAPCTLDPDAARCSRQPAEGAGRGPHMAV